MKNNKNNLFFSNLFFSLSIRKVNKNKNFKLQHQRLTKKEMEFPQQEEQVKLAIDRNV